MKQSKNKDRKHFLMNEYRAWMESDLSRLGEFDPYGWSEGKLDDGILVRHEPGWSLRIEGSKRKTNVGGVVRSCRRTAMALWKALSLISPRSILSPRSSPRPV